MGISEAIWADPVEFLRANAPDEPVLFFSPAALQARAAEFRAGFPGLVTYAVKANPDEAVIGNLAAAGVTAFDVASPAEIALVRRLVPGAVMHYNNPVRSRREIAAGIDARVASWSVDSASELAKLFDMLPERDTEIAVRFKLPVKGAAYDFGAKFGASEEQAVELLADVAAQGFLPALTFHPGTQCTDPAAWENYLHAAARISKAAGVELSRLNVGGGFPAHREAGAAPELAPIFARIHAAAVASFDTALPDLVCEPGRGMVAESFSLLTRIKAVRDATHVFLNDGVYGALAELPLMGTISRVEVRAPDGRMRSDDPVERIVFGPTCDSVDRLPGTLPLPADAQEDDYVLFHGMGAYSAVTSTQFNGFGGLSVVTTMALQS